MTETDHQTLLSAQELLCKIEKLEALYNERAIRLECLRLAGAHGSSNSTYAYCDQVLERARKYIDLVLGTSDAEIAGAAREFVEKVRDARG